MLARVDVQRLAEGAFDDIARQAGPDVGVFATCARLGVEEVVTRIVFAVACDVLLEESSERLRRVATEVVGAPVDLPSVRDAGGMRREPSGAGHRRCAYNCVRRGVSSEP